MRGILDILVLQSGHSSLREFLLQWLLAGGPVHLSKGMWECSLRTGALCDGQTRGENTGVCAGTEKYMVFRYEEEHLPEGAS